MIVLTLVEVIAARFCLNFCVDDCKTDIWSDCEVELRLGSNLEMVEVVAGNIVVGSVNVEKDDRFKYPANTLLCNECTDSGIY